MKITSTIALFLLFASSALFAQTNSKLAEAFTPEEIASLEKSNPSELSFLEFKASQCVFVQDLSGKKDISDMADIQEINKYARNGKEVKIVPSELNQSNFNVLMFDLGSDHNMMYYRIGDTGKLLQILSEERCRALYEERK